MKRTFTILAFTFLAVLMVSLWVGLSGIHTAKNTTPEKAATIGGSK
jgi:hypothetical protein